MVKRETVLNLRLPAEVKRDVVRAADADERSMSGMVVRILSESLVANEHLHEPRRARKGG